jgi:hypothetical protein
MEPIQCSETSAYKIQTPGNYPEDNILYPQQGKSLKTTIFWSFVLCETATSLGFLTRPGIWRGLVLSFRKQKCILCIIYAVVEVVGPTDNFTRLEANVFIYVSQVFSSQCCWPSLNFVIGPNSSSTNTPWDTGPLRSLIFYLFWNIN